MVNGVREKFVRIAVAAALVALMLGCGDNAPDTLPAAPANQAALDNAIGVWDGELNLPAGEARLRETRFGLILQTGGVAFMTAQEGLRRCEWLRDGDNVRITMQFAEGVATIAGVTSGPRLQGTITSPAMQDGAAFTAEQVGTWNVTPHADWTPFVGVWVASAGSDTNSGLAIILQPDGFAFLSGEGTGLYRGNWRVVGDAAQIRFNPSQDHDNGSDFPGFEVSATLREGKLAFVLEYPPPAGSRDLQIRRQAFQAVKQ